MSINKTITMFLCLLVILYVSYKIYALSTLENFSTRLQDGRSRNSMHPVNIRARYRKWKRTKPFNKSINKIKKILNYTIWQLLGRRKTF